MRTRSDESSLKDKIPRKILTWLSVCEKLGLYKNKTTKTVGANDVCILGLEKLHV